MTPWPQTPLNRLGTVALGKMISDRTVKGSVEMSYVRAAHIQPQGRWFEAAPQAMPFSPHEARGLDVRAGDVLVVEGGAGFGRSFYVSEDMTGWGFQNSINRFRPSTGASDGRFVAYALQAALATGRIELECSVSTIPHFTAEKLAAFKVSSPPLEAQICAGDFLDRETKKIDDLIAKQQSLIAVMDERRTSVVINMLSGSLLPESPVKSTGLRWLPRVPEHWTVGNIRRFSEMRTGHTPSRSMSEYWDESTVPWFTLADVWQLRDGRTTYLGDTKEEISEIGLANSSAELLPAGTVVFSRTASVGFSGIMPKPMSTSQDSDLLE